MLLHVRIHLFLHECLVELYYKIVLIGAKRAGNKLRCCDHTTHAQFLTLNFLYTHLLYLFGFVGRLQSDYKGMV